MIGDQVEGTMELSDFLDQSALTPGTSIFLQQRTSSKYGQADRLEQEQECTYRGLVEHGVLQDKVCFERADGRKMAIDPDHEVEIYYTNGTQIMIYGPELYHLEDLTKLPTG